MTAALLVFFAAIAIGTPIAFALGFAGTSYVLLSGLTSIDVIPTILFGGMDSFPLLAIPFFIMAGHLMNTGGITERIFNFARAMVGWLPGGLGHVNVGASVIFAGMSGAAVADAGGLGNIEIKAMRDAGYDTDFAVGITASSSTMRARRAGVPARVITGFGSCAFFGSAGARAASCCLSATRLSLNGVASRSGALGSANCSSPSAEVFGFPAFLRLRPMRFA